MSASDPGGPSTPRGRPRVLAAVAAVVVLAAGCGGGPTAGRPGVAAPTASAPSATPGTGLPTPRDSPSATASVPTASVPTASVPTATGTSADPAPDPTTTVPRPTPGASRPGAVPSISGVPTAGTTTGGVAVGLHSLVHGGRTRVWVQYTPPQGSAGRPLLVFLAGTDSTVRFEAARDRLLPLVAAGSFTLVYPVAYSESWNAGDGCCNEAAVEGLDDVDFVRTVTARAIALDHPDRARIYLSGYSAGGKIGWNLVCDDPGVFAALATYGANPENPCATDGPSLPVFIGFGAKDRAEPLAGEKTDSRGTHPPAADNLDAWLERDACPSGSRTQKTVDVVLQSWDCARSTTVVFALWPTQRHIWPQPPATTLAGSAGLQMWAFLSHQHTDRS